MKKALKIAKFCCTATCAVGWLVVNTKLFIDFSEKVILYYLNEKLDDVVIKKQG